MADADLPMAALEAWRAYQAMDASKQRHFQYLTELDDRYGADARASEPEKRRLQELLDEHDRCVFAFKQAVQVLKTKDPAAHRTLVDRLAQARF
ncbi:MAG: hypothetical protein ACREQV_15140 [Candidatus Binatia bacterium]